MPEGSSNLAVGREVQLALLCARRTLTDAQQQQVRELALGDIQEATLYAFTEWHGLTPLLYWHVDRACPGLDAPWLARLRRSFDQTLQWNLRLAAELRRLQSLLSADPLPVLAYKGPALAYDLYRHLGLRDSEDLDLLVRREHLSRASACLVAAGYLPEYDLAGMALEDYVAHACERNFVHPELGVMVELHWQITPPAFAVHFPEEEVWRDPQRLEFNQVSCSAPSLEVLLLALSTHGAKHMWERINWLVDIAELSGRDHTLDWERVRQMADRMHLRRVLHLAVQLAQNLVGGEMPPALAEGIRLDRPMQALAASLQGDLLGAHRAGKWERFRFGMQIRDSSRERARFVAAKLRHAFVRAPRRNPALEAGAVSANPSALVKANAGVGPHS
jgi:hypothetical protein